MGISVMAVDILPTSLPKDASAHFAGAVKEYVRTLVKEQRGASDGELGELGQALRRASVAVGGKVTGGEGSSFDDEFREVLEGKVRRWRETVTQSPSVSHDSSSTYGLAGKAEGTAGSPRKKRVLVLGSGMVAGPAVDHLASRRDVEVIVGQYVSAVRFGLFLLFLFFSRVDSQLVIC